MTAPDEPTLDEVMVPTEEVYPDHREHAKEGARPDTEDLDERARHEEQIVHGADPDELDVPDAED